MVADDFSVGVVHLSSNCIINCKGMSTKFWTISYFILMSLTNAFTLAAMLISIKSHTSNKIIHIAPQIIRIAFDTVRTVARISM